MFENLQEKLADAFKKFKNKGTLTEKDVKEGSYNPLYYAYGQKPTVKELFESSGKDISFAFSDIFASLKNAMENCKFYFNHDLIDNIILKGIPSVTLKILKKEKDK